MNWRKRRKADPTPEPAPLGSFIGCTFCGRELEAETDEAVLALADEAGWAVLNLNGMQVGLGCPACTEFMETLVAAVNERKTES